MYSRNKIKKNLYQTRKKAIFWLTLTVLLKRSLPAKPRVPCRSEFRSNNSDHNEVAGLSDLIAWLFQNLLFLRKDPHQ